MSEITVEVEESSLERSKSGTVTGKICISASGVFFPEHNWNDFIVTILVWWLRAFYELLKGEGQATEFRFMDGPFLARAKAVGSSVEMEFVDSRGGKSIGFASGSTAQFGYSLRSAATMVVKISKKKGWMGEDIQQLEELSKMVR